MSKLGTAKRWGTIMFEGNVVSIHVAEEAGTPMESRQHVEAIAGRGLEGDRYFHGTGHWSNSPGVSLRHCFEDMSGGAIRLAARCRLHIRTHDVRVLREAILTIVAVKLPWDQRSGSTL